MPALLGCHPPSDHMHSHSTLKRWPVVWPLCRCMPRVTILSQAVAKIGRAHSLCTFILYLVVHVFSFCAPYPVLWKMCVVSCPIVTYLLLVFFFMQNTILYCNSDVCIQDESLVSSKIPCKDWRRQVCCWINEPTSLCLVQVGQSGLRGQMKPCQSGRLGMIGLTECSMPPGSSSICLG